MRKLIVSMNLSLDGFLSGPRCELDWHFDCWNEDMGDKLLEFLHQADTLLLGRITYEGMARHWSGKTSRQDLPRQDLAIGYQMNQHTKIVFSKTVGKAIWNNTFFVQGDIQEQILKLKQATGKDILLFGSSKLVSALIRDGLVDEYRLWIHPVVLGKGKPLFDNSQKPMKLELKDSFLFGSGVMILYYVSPRV